MEAEESFFISKFGAKHLERFNGLKTLFRTILLNGSLPMANVTSVQID
jgi:hypothetical protein